MSSYTGRAMSSGHVNSSFLIPVSCRRSSAFWQRGCKTHGFIGPASAAFSGVRFHVAARNSDLLFVDCSYTIADPPRAEYRPNPEAPGRDGPLAWSSLLTIDESTITFDLYSVQDVGITN